MRNTSKQTLRLSPIHDYDCCCCCRTELGRLHCSIWTVDLAYLLRRSGLSVELTTITLGANPEYASEGFYKEHMEEDGSRVERLFRVRQDA